jgi:hypothetical protein
MNPLTTNTDCDFAKFFKELGYDYSWDFSKRLGEEWHELYENEELVFQCDMRIPLQQVIDDMCVEEEFDCGYFIAGGTQETYDDLCNRVRKHTGKTWKTLKDREEDKKSLAVTS